MNEAVRAKDTAREEILREHQESGAKGIYPDRYGSLVAKRAHEIKERAATSFKSDIKDLAKTYGSKGSQDQFVTIDFEDIEEGRPYEENGRYYIKKNGQKLPYRKAR